MMQPLLRPSFQGILWKRTVAGLLSLQLAFSWAGPVSAGPSWTLLIPASMGRLESYLPGSTDKRIILIQDAHDSLEAQENIARLIRYFVRKENVRTVFEEGYEGLVPTDKYFGQIEDPAIREKVAYFLMDHLRLGGAEYAHITSLSAKRIAHSENEKLLALGAIRRQRDRGRKSPFQIPNSTFQTMRKLQITKSKQIRRFPFFCTLQERLEFGHRKLEFVWNLAFGFWDCKFYWLGGAEYAHIVQQKWVQGAEYRGQGKQNKTAQNKLEARNNKVTISDASSLISNSSYPSLDRSVPRTQYPVPFFQLIGVDTDSLHRENIRQYDRARKLSPEIERDLKSIREQFYLLAQKQLPQPVLEWLKAREAWDRQDSKQVGAYFLHLQRSGIKLKDIDVNQLKQKVADYESEIQKTHLSTEPQRQIYSVIRQMDLLLSLQALEADSETYHQSVEALKDFDVQHLADLAAKESGVPMLFSKTWKSQIQAAVDFYRQAQGRDQGIASHLEDFFKNPDEKTAVMVFGGFHKSAILELLQKKGITCQTVLPDITHDSPEHRKRYAFLMSGGEYDFEVKSSKGTWYREAKQRYQVPFQSKAIFSKSLSSVQRWNSAPDLARSELRQLASAAAQVRSPNRILWPREMAQALKSAQKRGVAPFGVSKAKGATPLLGARSEMREESRNFSRRGFFRLMILGGAVAAASSFADPMPPSVLSDEVWDRIKKTYHAIFHVVDVFDSAEPVLTRLNIKKFLLRVAYAESRIANKRTREYWKPNENFGVFQLKAWPTLDVLIRQAGPEDKRKHLASLMKVFYHDADVDQLMMHLKKAYARMLSMKPKARVQTAKNWIGRKDSPFFSVRLRLKEPYAREFSFPSTSRAGAYRFAELLEEDVIFGAIMARLHFIDRNETIPHGLVSQADLWYREYCTPSGGGSRSYFKESSEALEAIIMDRNRAEYELREKAAGAKPRSELRQDPLSPAPTRARVKEAPATMTAGRRSELRAKKNFEPKLSRSSGNFWNFDLPQKKGAAHFLDMQRRGTFNFSIQAKLLKQGVTLENGDLNIDSLLHKLEEKINAKKKSSRRKEAHAVFQHLEKYWRAAGGRSMEMIRAIRYTNGSYALGGVYKKDQNWVMQLPAGMGVDEEFAMQMLFAAGMESMRLESAAPESLADADKLAAYVFGRGSEKTFQETYRAFVRLERNDFLNDAAQRFTEFDLPSPEQVTQDQKSARTRYYETAYLLHSWLSAEIKGFSHPVLEQAGFLARRFEALNMLQSASRQQWASSELEEKVYLRSRIITYPLLVFAVARRELAQTLIKIFQDIPALEQQRRRKIYISELTVNNSVLYQGPNPIGIAPGDYEEQRYRYQQWIQLALPLHQRTGFLTPFAQRPLIPGLAEGEGSKTVETYLASLVRRTYEDYPSWKYHASIGGTFGAISELTQSHETAGEQGPKIQIRVLGRALVASLLYPDYRGVYFDFLTLRECLNVSIYRQALMGTIHLYQGLRVKLDDDIEALLRDSSEALSRWVALHPFSPSNRMNDFLHSVFLTFARLPEASTPADITDRILEVQIPGDEMYWDSLERYFHGPEGSPDQNGFIRYMKESAKGEQARKHAILTSRRIWYFALFARRKGLLASLPGRLHFEPGSHRLTPESARHLFSVFGALFFGGPYRNKSSDGLFFIFNEFLKYIEIYPDGVGIVDVKGFNDFLTHMIYSPADRPDQINRDSIELWWNQVFLQNHPVEKSATSSETASPVGISGLGTADSGVGGTGDAKDPIQSQGQIPAEHPESRAEEVFPVETLGRRIPDGEPHFIRAEMAPFHSPERISPDHMLDAQFSFTKDGWIEWRGVYKENGLSIPHLGFRLVIEEIPAGTPILVRLREGKVLISLELSKSHPVIFRRIRSLDPVVTPVQHLANRLKPDRQRDLLEAARQLPAFELSALREEGIPVRIQQDFNGWLVPDPSDSSWESQHKSMDSGNVIPPEDGFYRIPATSDGLLRIRTSGSSGIFHFTPLEEGPLWIRRLGGRIFFMSGNSGKYLGFCKLENHVLPEPDADAVRSGIEAVKPLPQYFGGVEPSTFSEYRKLLALSEALGSDLSRKGVGYSKVVIRPSGSNEIFIDDQSGTIELSPDFLEDPTLLLRNNTFQKELETQDAWEKMQNVKKNLELIWAEENLRISGSSLPVLPERLTSEDRSRWTNAAAASDYEKTYVRAERLRTAISRFRDFEAWQKAAGGKNGEIGREHAKTLTDVRKYLEQAFREWITQDSQPSDRPEFYFFCPQSTRVWDKSSQYHANQKTDRGKSRFFHGAGIMMDGDYDFAFLDGQGKEGSFIVKSVGHAGGRRDTVFFIQIAREGQESADLYLFDMQTGKRIQGEQHRCKLARDGLNSHMDKILQEAEAQGSHLDRHRLKIMIGEFLEQLQISGESQFVSLRRQKDVLEILEPVFKNALSSKDYADELNYAELEMIFAYVLKDDEAALDKPGQAVDRAKKLKQVFHGSSALQWLSTFVDTAYSHTAEDSRDFDSRLALIWKFSYREKFSPAEEDEFTPYFETFFRDLIKPMASRDGWWEPESLMGLFNVLAVIRKSIFSGLAENPDAVRFENGKWQWSDPRSAQTNPAFSSMGQSNGTPWSYLWHTDPIKREPSPGQQFFIREWKAAEAERQKKLEMEAHTLPAGRRRITQREVRNSSVVVQPLQGEGNSMMMTQRFPDGRSVRILVDAGLDPKGNGLLYDEIREDHFPDVVIMTHAHPDHVQSLDRLIERLKSLRRNQKVPILMTEPTRLALSQFHQFNAALNHAVALEINQPFQAGPNLLIQLVHAGHIEGAAGVLLMTPQGNTLMTGDFSFQTVGFSPGFHWTDDMPRVHTAVIEATLADFTHLDGLTQEVRELQLKGRMKSTLRERGSVQIISGGGKLRSLYDVFESDADFREGKFLNWIAAGKTVRDIFGFVRRGYPGAVLAATKPMLDLSRVQTFSPYSIVFTDSAIEEEVLEVSRRMVSDPKNLIVLDYLEEKQLLDFAATLLRRMRREGYEDIFIEKGSFWLRKKEQDIAERGASLAPLNLFVHALASEIVEQMKKGKFPKSRNIILSHGSDSAQTQFAARLREAFGDEVRVSAEKFEINRHAFARDGILDEAGLAAHQEWFHSQWAKARPLPPFRSEVREVQASGAAEEQNIGRANGRRISASGVKQGGRSELREKNLAVPDFVWNWDWKTNPDHQLLPGQRFVVRNKHEFRLRFFIRGETKNDWRRTETAVKNSKGEWEVIVSDLAPGEYLLDFFWQNGFGEYGHYEGQPYFLKVLPPSSRLTNSDVRSEIRSLDEVIPPMTRRDLLKQALTGLAQRYVPKGTSSVTAGSPAERAPFYKIISLAQSFLEAGDEPNFKSMASQWMKLFPTVKAGSSEASPQTASDLANVMQSMREIIHEKLADPNLSPAAKEGYFEVITAIENPDLFPVWERIRRGCDHIRYAFNGAIYPDRPDAPTLFEKAIRANIRPDQPEKVADLIVEGMRPIVDEIQGKLTREIADVGLSAEGVPGHLREFTLAWKNLFMMDSVGHREALTAATQGLGRDPLYPMAMARKSAAERVLKPLLDGVDQDLRRQFGTQAWTERPSFRYSEPLRNVNPAAVAAEYRERATRKNLADQALRGLRQSPEFTKLSLEQRQQMEFEVATKSTGELQTFHPKRFLQTKLFSQAKALAGKVREAVRLDHPDGIHDAELFIRTDVEPKTISGIFLHVRRLSSGQIRSIPFPDRVSRRLVREWDSDPLPAGGLIHRFKIQPGTSAEDILKAFDHARHAPKDPVRGRIYYQVGRALLPAPMVFRSETRISTQGARTRKLSVSKHLHVDFGWLAAIFYMDDYLSYQLGYLNPWAFFSDHVTHDRSARIQPYRKRWASRFQLFHEPAYAIGLKIHELWKAEASEARSSEMKNLYRRLAAQLEKMAAESKKQMLGWPESLDRSKKDDREIVKRLEQYSKIIRALQELVRMLRFLLISQPQRLDLSKTIGELATLATDGQPYFWSRVRYRVQRDFSKLPQVVISPAGLGLMVLLLLKHFQFPYLPGETRHLHVKARVLSGKNQKTPEFIMALRSSRPVYRNHAMFRKKEFQAVQELAVQMGGHAVREVKNRRVRGYTIRLPLVRSEVHSTSDAMSPTSVELGSVRSELRTSTEKVKKSKKRMPVSVQARQELLEKHGFDLKQFLNLGHGVYSVDKKHQFLFRLQMGPSRAIAKFERYREPENQEFLGVIVDVFDLSSLQFIGKAERIVVQDEWGMFFSEPAHGLAHLKSNVMISDADLLKRYPNFKPENLEAAKKEHKNGHFSLDRDGSVIWFGDPPAIWIHPFYQNAARSRKGYTNGYRGLGSFLNFLADAAGVYHWNTDTHIFESTAPEFHEAIGARRGPRIPGSRNYEMDHSIGRNLKVPTITKTRSEIRQVQTSGTAQGTKLERLNRAMQSVAAIQLEDVKSGDLEAEIQGRILAEVGAPERGVAVSLSEYIHEMEQHRALIRTEDIPDAVDTAFGKIDLKYLNKPLAQDSPYRSAEGSLYLARDLHLAHLLGLITIQKFKGVSPSNKILQFLRRQKIRARSMSVRWADGFLLLSNFKKVKAEDLARDFKGDDGQIRFYEKVFKAKSKYKHTGSLYSVLSSLIPRELGWHRMDLNLVDVKKLREDLRKRLAEPGWIDGHQGDDKQIEYYEEVFGRETSDKHAGNLYSVIASMIPRELGWSKKELNLGDVKKLREEFRKSLSKPNWVVGHQGDEKQIEYYEEIFGEEVSDKHAGSLYSVLASLIPSELGWSRMNLNLGDAKKLREDFRKRLSEPGWMEGHQGDEKQIEYYEEIFGEDASDKHAGSLYSVLASLIPSELGWSRMNLNLGDAKKLREDFRKRLSEPGGMEGHQGDEKQVEYYEVVFGGEASDKHAGGLYSVLSGLIPRELGWSRMNLNLGDAKKLREDFRKKLAEPGWRASHQGDENQMEYYEEVFGDEASDKHAGNFYSVLSSLIPRDLGWTMMQLNLSGAKKLREDFREKLAEPGWVEAHRGDEKQIEYYEDAFGEGASDKHAGSLYSALSSLVPRKLDWSLMGLNLGDVKKLREDLRKRLAEPGWVERHQGEAGQVRYYREVFGAEVWSMHTNHLFSAIQSFLGERSGNESLTWKDVLGWKWIERPMSDFRSEVRKASVNGLASKRVTGSAGERVNELARTRVPEDSLTRALSPTRAPAYAHTRTLVDFNDAAQFSDAQIKEIMFAARSEMRHQASDSKVVIYNLDPTEALGKFFLQQQSNGLEIARGGIETVRSLRSFRGSIIHLSGMKSSLDASELDPRLAAAGFSGESPVLLAYQDETSGTLGLGLEDLEILQNAERLKQPLPKSYYGRDRQRRIIVSDPSATATWQETYEAAFAFSGAA